MDASMEDLAGCPGIVERKVKCLYDTFHEPFKRVVSHHPPIPETPSLKDVEPSSVNEVTKVKKDTEERKQNKEPELAVKSALSAAFSIYADKMGEKKNSSSQVGENSASKSGAENNNSGKRDS
ncbi:hypothetical protein CUMW_117190 [Citrus unshiu]|nr:hypothetical protein CUMW_117190 [Citrus unshiu]